MRNGIFASLIWSVFNLVFWITSIFVMRPTFYKPGVLYSAQEYASLFVSSHTAVIVLVVLYALSFIPFYFLGKWLLLHTQNSYTDICSALWLHLLFVLPMWYMGVSGHLLPESLLNWPQRTVESVLEYHQLAADPHNIFQDSYETYSLLSIVITFLPFAVMLLGLHGVGKKRGNPEEAAWEKKKTPKLLIILPITAVLAAVIWSAMNLLSGYLAPMQSAKPDAEKNAGAVAFYESVTSENIAQRMEEGKDDSDDFLSVFGSSVAWFEQEGLYMSCSYMSISNSPYYEKEASFGFGEDIKRFDIHAFAVGDSREKLLAALPLGCASSADCKYYEDGTTVESLKYCTYEAHRIYDYYFVFVNGELVYAYSKATEHTFPIYMGWKEANLPEQTEFGDTAYENRGLKISGELTYWGARVYEDAE